MNSSMKSPMLKTFLTVLLLTYGSMVYANQFSDTIKRQWTSNEFDTSGLTQQYVDVCLQSVFQTNPDSQVELCKHVAQELLTSTEQRSITLDQYISTISCTADQDPWEDDCYPKEDRVIDILHDATIVSLCQTQPTLVTDGSYSNFFKRESTIYDATRAVYDCSQQWFLNEAKQGQFTTKPNAIELYQYEDIHENFRYSIDYDQKDGFSKQINLLSDSQLNAVGHELLDTALKKGDVFFVKEILTAGVNPNTPNQFFSQPLATALRYGRNESAALLLAAGANPDIYDDHGNSSLYLAVENCSIDTVNLLLDKGVAVEGQLANLGSESLRPLAKAAEFGRLDVYTRLLTAGAKTDYPQPEPDDYNTLSLLESAIRSGNETIFNDLLAKGLTLPDRPVKSLIESAIKGGSIAILKSLFSMGIKVPPDEHTDILIALKNDIPSREDEQYPYQQHVQYQSTQQLDWLIEHGLNIEHREHGAFDYIVRLTSIYSDPAKADDPVRRKYQTERQAFTLSAIQHYADAGLDLNYVDEKTLLSDAVRGENLAMVELLLELGADKNTEIRPGKTALSMAGYNLSKKIKDFPKWQDNRADIEKIYYLLDGKKEDLPTIPDKPPLTIENVLRQMLKN